jgi:hypothetical protein
MTEQEVEDQGHGKERQPDSHGLLPARRALQAAVAEPTFGTADPMHMRLGEQIAAAAQP